MKHTKESIKQLLLTNDKALIQGLLVIHGLQTADEKTLHTVSHDNGVGFSPFHVEFGTNLAEFYLKRKFLSPKQLAALRKMMQRYAGQLAKVANGEIPNPLSAATPSPKAATPSVTEAEQANAQGLDADERESYNKYVENSAPVPVAIIERLDW